MLTHTVLFAIASPDEIEDRGPIAMDEACQLFLTFPFAQELEKRSRNPDLTVPTITFTDSSGSNLAIWSDVPGKFLIWIPAIFGLVDGVTDRNDVVDCIELFFRSQIEVLEEKITQLEAKYRAS